MAVGPLHESSLFKHHRMGDERRPHDSVVLAKQHAREKVEMRAAEVADRGQLAGIVVPGDPAPLYLAARAVRRDGVNVGLRVA